uniref:Nuclear factor related to kappa-B-binding protein n=1 Tax=Lygus hesperus TaxID=30085 RepID=A0A0A9VY26_LYGHE
MAVWGENWSSGSDTDESGSSYHSDDSSQSGRMESARILGETFHFPQGLCDNPEIFKEVLSIDTWNNFTLEQRQHLENFLPSFPENDEEEKEKTLGLLFNRENIKFGNPLTDFHNQLQSAYFRPDLARMRSLLRKAQYKDYKRAERWRIFELLKSVLSSRQRLVDAVINGEKTKPCPPPPKKPRTSQLSQNVKNRYFQELALIREEVGESDLSSEDESYPGGPSLGHTKKLRRTSTVSELLESDAATPILGTLCTGPNPWDPSGKPQHNPYAHPEQSYAQILAQHTKRRTNREDHPDLHTEGITLQDVALRCKFLKKPTSKPIVQRKIKMKVVRSQSVSSPAVEEEIDEVTDIEENFIKQEEEEESKVDIEALDELPLPPVSVLHKPHSSSSSHSHNHGSISKHHSISSSSKISSLLLSKKIKVEHSEPIPSIKKTVSLFEPELKKSRSDSTESRKSKTSDSVDSLIKKIKLEPDPLSPKKVKVEPVEIPLTTIKAEPPPTPITPVTPLIPPLSSSTQQTVISSQPTIFSTSPVKITPSTRILTPATLSDLDGYNMMDLPIDFDETPPVDLDDIKPHPELMQETHACFFSLIRDILLSTPDHRIEMKELELRVKAWASSPIGPINQWYTPQLESQLASAVLFLAGDLTALPDDYVPYMEWKSNVGAYQWIGAGRDSDHRLSVLCSLWLDRGADRGGPSTTTVATTTTTIATTTITTTTTVATTTTTSNATTQVGITPDPPPRGPAVQPTSPRKKELFRLQEKQRYEIPHKAFSYNVGGAETTVGPVRSQQTGNLSRARGHTLLVEDRPKHVTILELVRDAVARLPNAQGTRADIVTLLKDSQYLTDSAPEGMLSSVVSSALDRLHYEHDPIVKYDTKRKIWMYLHKGRSAEEHERMHALGVDVKPTRPKSARKPPKPKKEAVPKTATATVSTAVDPNVITEVPVSVTDSSTSTTTSTVPVTSGNVPLVPSPLVVQAKPKTTLKTTPAAAATKKVTAEGVKTMLGKTKLKLQESSAALTAQQQLARLQAATSLPQTSSVGTSPKKTAELSKTAPTSIVPPRSVLHEPTSVSTSTVKSQTPSMTKKVGNQTVTLSAEQPGKQSGKSIVKVITSQGTSQSVRTMQRLNQQVSQQQILQLKQQLMAESPNLLQKSQMKKPNATGPQQLLVRMQGEQGAPGPGQVIVINQQQILVDSPQLAQQLKQQPKQLQQFLSKQQVQVQQVDSQVQQSSAQTTQTTGTTNTVQKVTPHQQQQLNQLILNKQQQILIGDQQKGGKGQSQMILMKQQGTPVSSADGSKPHVQQMILAVKPGTDGEGTQITPQQLHQMIVLNKQQNQQQIYMVKPDQKSLQVITQQPLKAQTQQLTLAQIQQLQQQQQRSAGTSAILNTSRVVAQVSSASVNTAATALFKPQVVTGSSGTQMVAKVVTSSQNPVLTMENLLAQHKQQSVTQQAGVRLPAVSRALTSQYVVSLPQTRVVQTTVQQVVATTSATGVMAVTTMGNTEASKIAASQGVRIPGLNLANIAGKQVLLASKPHVGGSVQGQNVLLGNAGGQALLVGGNQQGTVTVLQQGSQQILLPPGVVKTIQGLKVIPLAQGKPNQGQPGRHQMIARISGMRPVLATNIVQEAVPTSQTPQTVQLTQPSSSTQSKD